MNQFLDSTKRIFLLYKQMGEKAIAQVSDADLGWQQNNDSNSVITIVKHMAGNMLSRWTDFLTTDGEKPWRNRDTEFETEQLDRAAMLARWEQGWQCLFSALDSLTENDLDRIVYARNEGQTVMDAINRQVAHYAYHLGQIVYIAKLRSSNDWHTLSIPLGKSEEYNAAMFAKAKEEKHFTEGWIEKK